MEELVTDNVVEQKYMVRSSAHSVKFCNKDKLVVLDNFLDEYRRVLGIYRDHIWENGYSWTTKDGVEHIFFVPDQRYEHPKFIDYNFIKVETSLSARALSSMVTQLCGILGGAVEKQKKNQYKLAKMIEEGKKPTAKFLKKMKNDIPRKPRVSNVQPELSSKCADIVMKKDGEFNAFLQLKSIGDVYSKIRIPIKFTKASNKWFNKGTIKNSFLISNKSVCLRYDVPIKVKTNGETVGADQGKNTVLSFSNNQVTPHKDIHGHSLHSIMEKMSRQKKGSKAFKKSQRLRETFINWDINQLDLSNIKEIKIEKVVNIFSGKRRSRIMSHWTNTIIRDKIKARAQEEEVLLTEQSSAFRSQRCSSCGFVHSRNRKKKVFTCLSCGFTIDADINAARNHNVELPNIPFWLCRSGLNKTTGFFWKPEGLFDLVGVELRVPPQNSKV